MIIKENKVLLLFHKEHKYYLFPGGKLESGETFEQAARREVKEELNINVILKKPLGTFKFTAYTGQYFEGKAFLIKNIIGTIKLLEPHKFDHLFWMPIEEYNKHKVSPNVKHFCEILSQKK